MGKRFRRGVTTGAVVAAACAGMIASASPAGAAPTVQTVIPGLNTPRGITFDAQGNLYVAESGVAGSGGAGLTQSGQVTKYQATSPDAVWQRGFQSVYASEDPSSPPDVLGPEGISAFGNGCTGHSNGCQVAVIMSESHDGIAAATGGAVQTTQAGHLFRLHGAQGMPTDSADVGDQQYQWTGDHRSLFPADFPDSNPYGLLVTTDAHSGRTRTFVADAGANTISEVMPNGVTRVIAYIPNETAPPFRDATPTCIAQGPDGMLYVATLHLLDLFALGQTGTADVWRINPDANFPTPPTLWAHGLTTATACTFDRAGNFWATEMFAPTGATSPPGDLVRIPFNDPTHIDHIGTPGQIPLPGGIAQGPDGAMYVSINSSSPVPGSGAIIKVTA